MFVEVDLNQPNSPHVEPPRGGVDEPPLLPVSWPEWLLASWPRVPLLWMLLFVWLFLWGSLAGYHSQTKFVVSVHSVSDR